MKRKSAFDDMLGDRDSRFPAQNSRTATSAQDKSKPRPPFWAIGCISLIVLFFVGLIALMIATTFVTQRDWFSSLGYTSIFDIGWQTKWGLFFAFFVPTLVLLVANAFVFRWSWRKKANDSAGTAFIIFGALLVGAVIVALFVGILGSGHWSDYLLYAHAQSAHVSDPVFGQDISFYLFVLPFLHSVANLLILIAFLGVGSIVAAEAIMLGQNNDDDRMSYSAKPSQAPKSGPFISHAAALHAALWIAALLALWGWGQWLGRFDYIYSHGSLVSGAGFVDIHVSIPWQERALYVGIALALVVLIAGFLRGRFLASVAAAPIVFILYWFVGGTVASWTQNFQVKPNEYKLEQPYLQSQISGTQNAYNLTPIKSAPYAISTTPASGSSSAAAPTSITNLIMDPRLWDWPQLQEVYTQRQALRPYYTFPDVDIDRYIINGIYQQVELAARELDASQLPQQAQTWTNQKIVYTHGYGVVASPVDQSTSDGYPTYYASDIPSTGPLTVSQPDIYYGENASGYVLAPNTANEFDHPSATGDATTHYTGTHAPLVSNHRFLWACATLDINVLISPQVAPNTRILMNRDPLTRAKALMPYLTYDSDPYLVVGSDGKLYWIIDAYTTSNSYPYSEQSSSGYNYIRNSVKVVIDAYEGTTDFYVVDPADPIAATLAAIYPGVFKPIAQMPVDLQAHLRYPETLFDVQAKMLLTYHVSDTQVFYNRGDVWDIPSIQNTPTTTSQMVPYYVLATLPGQTKPEFLMILPLTPQGRSNLVGWMVARMDHGEYGQVNTYILPKDQNVDGPGQVSAQIQQNQTISASFSLLDQHGSQVIQGNLLAFPTSQGFLYLQPVYLRASSGASQPQLTKVILVLNGKVIYANSLAEAMAQLTGQATPTPSTTPPPAGTTIASLIQQAVALDAQAQAALKAGDPVAYAQAEQQLHVVLQQLAALEKASTP
jgi:uncharacterized membrane protein (UPF0182 family)